MNGHLVSLLACIYAANARVLAMQAENAQRQALGQSMAYTDSDFHYEAQELDKLAAEAKSQP